MVDNEQSHRLEERDVHEKRSREGGCRVFKGLCALFFLAGYMMLYINLSSNPQVLQVVYSDSEKAPDKDSWSGKAPNRTELASLRAQHVNKVAASFARVFQPMAADTWCIDSRLKFKQAKRRPMGLCYLPIPLAHANILTGINVRIARNLARRNGLEDSCIRHDGPMPGIYYQKRELERSYLWTMVRDPTERALNRVAFTLSRQGRAKSISTADPQTTTELVMDALRTSTDIQYGTISEGRGGFQVQYTMMNFIPEYFMWNTTDPTQVLHAKQLIREVKRIINGYNFIGIAERLDESLVALQLLLGLEVTDILYFASQLDYPYVPKSLGPEAKSVQCLRSLDPQLLKTPQVDNYLYSSTWWAQNYGDMLLHQAASQSLDQTIWKIGLPVFAQALREFRDTLKRAHAQCPKPTFPCSKDGKDQLDKSYDDCYFEDIGCGHPCLDQFSRQYSESSSPNLTQTS